MESLHDIVVEGVTAFSAQPLTSYRYVIELKSSKMSIWLEDRATKKQWFKGGLAKTDYVSSANAIPDASVVDYVKCFQDTLDCELDDSSDGQRKISPLKNGALQLELSVMIRVLRASWVAKYTFDLDSVSVERIDILESKLRDQQDELEKLRGELVKGKALPFVKLTASNTNGTVICWSSVESDEFTSTGLDGKIKISRGGVYSVGVVVNTSQGYGEPITLLKNDDSIQLAYSAQQNNFSSSQTTTLYTIERLEENDVLTTTYRSSLAKTSCLSIIRFGS